MDSALLELSNLAEEFGLSDIVEDIEEQVDDFVSRGKKWADDTKEIWSKTEEGVRNWTPVQTGNLASSVTTDVALPYIRVGVIASKAPYSEAPNVGSKTGYGTDFIDAIWFTYAENYGNKAFPGEIKQWQRS